MILNDVWVISSIVSYTNLNDQYCCRCYAINNHSHLSGFLLFISNVLANLNDSKGCLGE